MEGMASYRRLISYIYAYEGKIKGKNIGFAKLESRNGQCKLSVNVKKVYMGGGDLGVYLLSQEKEIRLGTIFIRGGAGEFRTSISVDNTADSGISLERSDGLSIREKDDAWRSYTTIWEDEVAQAAEVELAEVTSEKLGNPEQQLNKKIEELEKEISENEGAQQKAPEEPEPMPAPQREPEPEPMPAPQREPEPEPMPAPQREPVPEPMPAPHPVPEPHPAPQPVPHTEPRPAPEVPRPAAPPEDTPVLEELENPETLRQLEQEEERAGASRDLWDSFRKRCPKIQAFESSGSNEVLTIKPQDIGLLPREVWTYGNNSFLLHGYYNYRYLILARVQDGRRVRYILGVPGHYYSNEKYMASMFGFPHFVLSKKQPVQDGRFGYWYTDIRMENQDG